MKRPTFSPARPRRSEAPAPLAGVTVLEFGATMAPAFGAMILEELGAEIVMIAEPQTGALGLAKPHVGGMGAYFVAPDRDRKSIPIDITSPAGRNLILRLMGMADVVVDNDMPRVMRNVQLDYESIAERCPHLIYCSVSPGGERPFIDFTTAMNGVVAILAALQARERMGKGRRLDVSIHETAISSLAYPGPDDLPTGEASLVVGRRPRICSPGGEFEAADGALWMMITSDKMFRRLCFEVLERPDLCDDPRFAKRLDREQNYIAATAAVQEVLWSRTRDEWVKAMSAAGIRADSIRSRPEAMVAPVTRQMQIQGSVRHRLTGDVPSIAPALRRMCEAPAGDPATPSLLGEHTQKVLTRLLNMSPWDFRQYAEAGAFGASFAEAFG